MPIIEDHRERHPESEPDCQDCLEISEIIDEAAITQETKVMELIAKYKSSLERMRLMKRDADKDACRYIAQAVLSASIEDYERFIEDLYSLTDIVIDAEGGREILRRLTVWHDTRYVKYLGESFQSIIDDAKAILKSEGKDDDN